MNFEILVQSIQDLHRRLASQAAKAVNISLTLRNWLIGYYIQEYEQRGEDRAQYSEGLLDLLSKKLSRQGLDRCGERELRRYRKFYGTYPQIRESLTPEFKISIPDSPSEKRESVTPVLLDGRTLIEKLSFTHLAELIAIDDPVKRAFYEMECIRGNWSVRELKRQIASLLYERSGLSRDKTRLAEMTQALAETQPTQLTVRDPYIFEFLGLKAAEVMSESGLEDALLDRLQDFMLELGHGFCFEARQKRLLIGDEYFFVDLVFYHRILKCHVLIELKLQAFGHESLGQLNTYLNWFREHAMTEGDNPPVGILLCTEKNHALVHYATAGLDNQLFVSKYQLQLPDQQQMQQFIEEQLRQALK